MSRQTSQPFRCHPLSDLTRQLLFAPPDRRCEQIHRAEVLHDEIDPDQNYPFDYISYRITGFRSESVPPMLLIGQAIRPDLRLMIDRLSHSAPIPVTDEDPIQTPHQLANRLGVSTKTIARWRHLGLRWRWVVGPGQRKKFVAFSTAAVEHFLARHPDRVARAGRHTHIDPQSRKRLIERARRIAQTTDASLNQVAAHLAHRIGRAHQTVRVILEQHDHDHPQDKIFAHRKAPLNAKQRRLIARAHRQGQPIGQIARRYRRTRSTIYRAVRHRRAIAIRRIRISYTTSPLFERQDAMQTLFPPPTTKDRVTRSTRATRCVTVPSDLPPPLWPLLNRPASSPDRQQTMLLQFNYLKFKAAQLRDHLDAYDPRAAELEQIRTLLRDAATMRNRLVVDNLPIVLLAARRHLIEQPDRSTAHLIEMLEAGIPVLIDAIDRYDINRAQTFESDVTWSLMRRYLSHPWSDGPPPLRAHRKLDPTAAVDRIRRAAASRRVRLALDDDRLALGENPQTHQS